MAANGTELAQLFEAKWFRRLAVHYPQNVLRALAPLSFRELAGGGRGLAVQRINNPRAITDGPDILRAGQPHVRLGQQTALFFGRFEALDHWSGRISHGTNDRAPFNELAVLQSHPFGRRLSDARIQEHFDAGALHLLAGELAQARADPP